MNLDPAKFLGRAGIKRLLKALDASKGTARFVGGAVRDHLLGEIPGDLDLATTLSPEKVVGRLEAAGLAVIYDDRRQVSPGVKFKDSELIGVPTIVVVGRGLADGTIEVKDRRSGERRVVPVDSAVAEVVAELRGSGHAPT